MGKSIRGWLYQQWVQIRGNLKWQLVWSFVEPYWKLNEIKILVGAIISMIVAAITFAREWITELSFPFLFLFFFGVYGVCWWIAVQVRAIYHGAKPLAEVEQQRNVEQQHPIPEPVSIARIPKSFLSWTPPTGKFHTGLRECIRRGRDLLEFYLSPERESDQPHRIWKLGVGSYIFSRANNVGKGSFAVRWGEHVSPTDAPSLPAELHGRNRTLYADILSRIQLLERFVRELED